MSAASGPRGLYYTLANSTRWSGAAWLRGYDALPGSIRALLKVLEGTGLKGNLHCDGVGFEKLAAEAPEVLTALRDAVGAERVEIVGGTYGVPVGVLHGGESNVRQRVYGVRVTRRLLGTTPRVALEPQFGFFPQLPQILSGCGFSGAALCYQRTWSAPQVPDEGVPLVLLEGLDGTRLPTVVPGSSAIGALAEGLERARAESSGAGLGDAGNADLHWLQWFELGFAPGWPADAKGLIQALRGLQSDERFDLRAPVVSDLIAALGADPEAVPVRQYGLDDVWHGMALGKNADYMPRYSRMGEEQLLAAEAVASLASLFGHPYAGWNVYPAWELEESWRELLVAQSCEAHEREGLVGSVGERSFERSLGLSAVTLQRSLAYLAERVDAVEGASLVFNPLGWTRDVPHQDGVVRGVPPYGYKTVDPYDLEESPLGRIELRTFEREVELARGDFKVTIDRGTGLVRQIQSSTHPDGLLHKDRPLGVLSMLHEGEREDFGTVSFSTDSVEDPEFAEFVFLREGRGGSRVRVTYSLSPLLDALWVRVHAESLARPDGGVRAGLRTAIEPAFEGFEIVHDHPYGISAARAEHDRVRVQPGRADGDPPAEPKLESELIEKPFTALSMVDLLSLDAKGQGDGSGLLVVHDGSQSWFRTERGVEVALSMYDPFDGQHWDNVFEAELFFAPHGPVSDTDRAMVSMELNLGSPRFDDHAVVRGGGDLPPVFGALSVEAESVIPTAIYREGRRVAEHVPGHFASAVRDPLVVRLVEYDGQAADVILRVPGPVARAARTTPLGEVLEELAPGPCDAPFGPKELPWTELSLKLRPNEIATIMIDAELARETHSPRAVQRQLWT